MDIWVAAGCDEGDFRGREWVVGGEGEGEEPAPRRVGGPGGAEEGGGPGEEVVLGGGGEGGEGRGGGRGGLDCFEFVEEAF